MITLTRKVLGRRIREIRYRLDKSQEEFGKMLGVSGATISSIENGDSWMRLPMVAKVCEIGNVSPNWILTGREQIDRATPQPDEGDEQELLRLYRELDEDARKALLTLLKKTIKS